ncbi:MAG: hypothetical protein JRF32_13150 [Deltaproteobacteria bacterium]|nr:hypothetical protein [Deltaproteobacteria bacterium]MBW2177434.1 hypothetical protein [Deltaproteobacteria bacterium]MBW2298540.1 hypothetical protein [Deltaproteobacteria bacterium]MBW2613961.1 hypothetical protein [Deltaproteobacteria bacterium]MBW2678385.1 hypothetical protein [Deltaproteobacteria bacterium]
MRTRKKKIEQRIHKRFSAKAKTFAVLRSEEPGLDQIKKMSMGEIACAVYNSKPARMGQIVDMSQGGLSFDYIDGDDTGKTHLKLDILSANEKFYMDKISFKSIRDVKTANELSFSPITMKKQGIQFVGLTFQQLSRLEKFLRKHTDGEVPV